MLPPRAQVPCPVAAVLVASFRISQHVIPGYRGITLHPSATPECLLLHGCRCGTKHTLSYPQP